MPPDDPYRLPKPSDYADAFRARPLDASNQMALIRVPRKVAPEVERLVAEWREQRRDADATRRTT